MRTICCDDSQASSDVMLLAPHSLSMRRWLLYLLFFIVLVGAYFSSAFYKGLLLAPNDGATYFYPIYQASRTMWTTNLFGGYPLMADPQAMSFYPPSYLLSRLPHAWDPFTWNLLVLSAYVMAGFFTFGLIYEITADEFASLVGGVVFPLSGMMVAHLCHLSLIHTAAWLPLMLWAALRLRRRISRRWFIIASIALAMNILAGHPQMTLYSFTLLGVYVLVLGVSRSENRRRDAQVPGPTRLGEMWRYLGTWGGVFVLAVCLAAVQLLPSLQLSRHMERGASTFEFFTSYALPPKQFITALFPYLFGGPDASSYTRQYIGQWNFHEMTIYVGLLPLILAAVAMGSRRRRRRLHVCFFLGVAVVCGLLAMGAATPLAGWMFHLPLYNRFRAPARHWIEGTLAMSVLAGIGMAHLRDHARARTMAVMFGILLLAVMAVFSVLFLPSILSGRDGTVNLGASSWLSNPRIQIPLATALLSVLAVGVMARGVRPWKRILLLSILIADLASFGQFLPWRNESPTPQAIAMPPQLGVMRRDLREHHQRLLSLDGSFSRLEEARVNNSLAWKLPNAGGYSPMMLRRLNELTGMSGNGQLPLPKDVGESSHLESARMPAEIKRSLDLLAIRYVLPSPWQIDLFENDPHWQRVDRYSGVMVYLNKRAMPRAWIVGRVMQLPARRIAQCITGGTLPDGSPFDPRAVALVESPPPSMPAAAPHATTQILSVKSDTVRLRTTSDEAGFLVLSDVNYPGWEATIDGKPTTVYQTDYLLRGIRLPAGEHQVVFKFRPWTFYAGAAVSLAGVLAAGLVIVHPFKGRRPLN